MGDDIGSGSVTDCRLRSDSDPLSSTNLPYGENQNKPFYQFWCHHPLITQLSLIISLFLGAQADRWALYPSTKGKAEEAVKELDFARTSIYRPGLLITERQESRSLEKFGQWVAGFLDTSFKVSIKTEDLAKAMVFNAINKNFEGKTETIEHAAILNISKEATEVPKI